MSEQQGSQQDGGKDVGGSLPQEDVEDRPNITPVKPEDYPEADRAKGA